MCFGCYIAEFEQGLCVIFTFVLTAKRWAEIALFSAVVLGAVFVHRGAFVVVSAFHSWQKKVPNLFASLESCFWCEEAGQTRLFPCTNEPVVISHEGCHIPRGTFQPSYSALHSTCHDQGMEN